MPPSWTSSEVEERKNSCRKFSSSMEMADGIPGKRGVQSPSGSRRDCQQLELVSEHLTLYACAVTACVLTPRSLSWAAKEFHPLHSTEARSSDLPSAVSPSSDSLRLPDGYLTSQKSMRRASQAVLRNQGDWLALPAPVEPQHPSNPGEQPRVEHWGAVSFIPSSLPLLQRKDLTPLLFQQALLSSPVRGALNPIFVSPGHRLSLEMSVRLTLACTRNGKVPEPIRCADLFGTSEGPVLNRASLFKLLTRLFCSSRSARSQETLVPVV